MRFDEPMETKNMPEGGGDFDLVPASDYQATIQGAEIKETKAGTGKYVSVQLKIDGPTHAGRVLFANLNISNPNPKAEEIGRRQLLEIIAAGGMTEAEDTDQLIGISLLVKVVIKKGSGDYPDDSNEIKGYKSLSGSAPPKAAKAADAAPWAAQPAPVAEQ